MPDLVLVGVEARLAERTDAAGVTVDQLVECSPYRNGSAPIAPSELERWLLDEGFAESDGARLIPTDRARALVKLLGVNV